MKETWDLFDENRQPLERQITRGEPLAEKEYHVVVVVWTVDREGNILLTKRAPEKEFFPNEWENSGGAVLTGESSREAAARELREETGLLADKDSLLLLESCRERNYFADIYLAVLPERQPPVTFQPGETVDAKWVTFDELEKKMARGELIEPAIRQFEPIRKRLKERITAIANKSLFI